MPAGRSNPSRRTPLKLGRRHARLALLGVLVAVLGWLGIRWYLDRRGIARHVRQGLELLDQAVQPADVPPLLDRWEDATRPQWGPRVDEFIEHLYRRCDLGDPRIRQLLMRVSGADYGERRADWARWYENRQRHAAGEAPLVSGSERVRLEAQWQAPIGLTAWFTTILPLDGHVFVASLGTQFDQSEDETDGVVRVDGRTGRSEYFFAPPAGPGRGPRDVVGIAAATDGLFAACRNGAVYCLARDGAVRWQAHVGSPVVGPPLSYDFNNDGADDPLVVTQAGKVVALSGRTGRTAWVADVARAAPDGSDFLGATLAAADCVPDGGTELVVTAPSGDVTVLSIRTGERRARDVLDAGTIAGVICGAGDAQAARAYVGDRALRILYSVVTPGRFELALWKRAALRRDETLVAALRTLPTLAEAPPRLLVCPTGPYAARWGALSAVEPAGIVWRLPLGGALWGTPAVADINGDRRAEIIVVALEPAETGGATGVLWVVSENGHALLRLVLDAPVEAAPVVTDVDGDGQLDVLIADQAGQLHCFATGRRGPVHWGLHGGDSHNTRAARNAYAFGQVPHGYQWSWQPQ